MQNDKVIDFLNELVRFRQKEISQMENAKCPEKMLIAYADRTSLLLKLIQKYEAYRNSADVENDSKQPQHNAELEELKLKYNAAIQICADFDNYKKRMQKQLVDASAAANKKLLLDLLNIVDDFDRVQKSMESYESNPVIEGIKLVYGNLIKVLENESCKKIECKAGDKFDVNFHEAVAVLPHEPGQDNSGTIAQIMQQGWTLNGNLLRAAKVIVQQ